jgi:hypothetical protein
MATVTSITDRQPTVYERRAANASGFLGRLVSMYWKWAPGGRCAEIETRLGPNMDQASCVFTYAGRSYRVTVEQMDG